MGAKIKTKKYPWTKIWTKKKSHAEFPSHKNFQKALNDITITNVQIILNAQKNPFLNQAAQKSTCQNFSTHPEIENF